jgi:hypothetical protein
MRRCVSSSLRPFGLQAAIFLDRCGFIVRLGVEDEAHQGEWKVRDFVDAMLNFSLFRTMLSLTVDGTSLPIDIRHVYRLIDEANDSSREAYTLKDRTVKKILVSELVPPALVKTKRLLLSHFCMGTFFALLAAGLDDRFGTLKFLVHPEYVASAGSALRFLMSNREAIEVRFVPALCVRHAGAMRVLSPVLRSCEQLSARVSAPAFSTRVFFCSAC